MKTVLTKKQIALLFFIIFTNCGTPTIDNAAIPERSAIAFPPLVSDIYFNTGFLAQYESVAQSLIRDEGFQEVFFNSTDGKKLNGLLRAREDSHYNIIFCAGFCPGRKEGLATFIRLVPPHANILFFDARGHGKSNGRFLTNLHNYGVDEYKDILGAIQFVRQQTHKPIIIHGICAGAFHAAQALASIDTDEHEIKGLIFDSGLDSMLNAISIPEKHLKEKTVPELVHILYPNDSKTAVRERYITRALASVVGIFMKALAAVLMPFLKMKEKQIDLAQKISRIQCPILYIHALNDSYSPISCAQALYNKTKNKDCWWITQSEHAVNHLKHKDEYRHVLNRFLESRIKA